MRTWTLLLGGLVVWAAHFFLLYGIASLLPGQSAADWLVLAATVPADGLVLRLAFASMRTGDALDSWAARAGAAGAAISLAAVVWQAAPAMLV
jgi:hypothetical protein